MLNDFWLHNLIFKLRDVRLKKAFKVVPAAELTTWLCIILNTIVSLTKLSISGAVLSNMLEKIVSIHLSISKDEYLLHWLVWKMTLFWHIIIVASGKYLFTERALGTGPRHGKLAQLITKWPLKEKINDAITREGEEQ